MSQVSSQGQDPSWISIPFEKFSHNTSRIGTRKYAWSHIGPRNDLYFVIRNVRAVDDQGNYTTRVVLKISAGSEVLETQDLGDLVACYKQFDPSVDSENPVQVVIRPPVWLAMVYPKSSTTVQRTQYKFFSEGDFDKVVAIFKELGFPTRESPAPGPPQISTFSVPPLPSSSPALSMFSNSSVSTASTVTSSVSRPLSALRSSPLTNEFYPGQTSNQLTFKLPQVPCVTNSERQLSLLPFSTPHNAAASPLATLVLPKMSSGIPGQEALHNSVKHSSLYITQMDKEISLSSDSIRPILQPSETSLHPSPSLISPKEPTKIDENLNKKDLCRQGRYSPFFSTKPEDRLSERPSSSGPFARLRRNFDDDVLTSTPLLGRPSSAPTDPSAIQDLAIPPKRALPFPPPKKTRATSLADLPPLPTPTPVNRSESIIKPPILPDMKVSTSTVKSTKKRVAQRKGGQPAQEQQHFTTAPVKLDQKSVIPDPLFITAEGDVSPLAAKSAAAFRPSSAASVLQSKETTTTKKRPAPILPTSAAKRPKMVDHSTQTEPYFGYIVSASASGAVPELVKNAESPASPPLDYLDTIDKFITKQKARPPPTEIYHTQEYLQASPEEREVLINNFICENLQNPEFVQLCKDVEHSWRRIGFGM